MKVWKWWQKKGKVMNKREAKSKSERESEGEDNGCEKRWQKKGKDDKKILGKVAQQRDVGRVGVGKTEKGRDRKSVV